MADTQASIAEIFDWVSETSLSSLAPQQVPGASDSELKRLSLLGVLIAGQLGDRAPLSLRKALSSDAEIVVPDRVKRAFASLLESDAAVHFADLYASIVSPSNRRPLGTFFTPREFAQAIVEGFSSRHASPSQVVDVGAGVGIFSESARYQWPAARILAIDINPLTLGLQAVAAERLPGRGVELELADYLKWMETFSPAGPTLYLGNPPYTRWQLLSQEYRSSLLAASDGIVGARANLSTLFLALTLARLRPEDSLAMIIPAGWMRAGYGENLRRWLRLENNRQISLRLADSWKFDNAIVDAVLVEVGPVADLLQPIVVTNWSESELVPVSRTAGGQPFPAPGRRLMDAPDAGSQVSMSQFARISRGTATGANWFFANSASHWETLGIPPEYRVPVARRMRPGIDAREPSVEREELMVLAGYEVGANANVDAWIGSAERGGTHTQYLCSTRETWFDLSVEVRIPDVLISALARKTFHVYENVDGLAILNNLFGLYWRKGATSHEKETILTWLRGVEGQMVLQSSSSVEANGLYRLSPRNVSKLAFAKEMSIGRPADLSLEGLTNDRGGNS